MKFLDALREEEPSSEVAFHLEGLLDASEKIRSWLAALSPAPDPEPERKAEILTYLQVEIYSHLLYHVKELESPFQAPVLAAYEGSAAPTPKPTQGRDAAFRPPDSPRAQRPSAPRVPRSPARKGGKR